MLLFKFNLPYSIKRQAPNKPRVSIQVVFENKPLKQLLKV